MILYMVIAFGLFVFGMLSLFSIGIYFLFVALAMLAVSWAWSGKPWIVAGTVSGAVSAVMVHVLTAPLRCGTYSTAGASGHSERSSCSRILLPDVRGLDTTEANLLALSLALGVGVLVALLVGRAVRRNPDPV